MATWGRTTDIEFVYGVTLNGNKVVAEPTKSVDYNAGPKSTEFHLQNSGGFPPGDYSVDVLIDGVQVGTRNFKVGE